MLRKVLLRCVPPEFMPIFSEYSQWDEHFLKSGSSFDGSPPSIACMISDVYARRNGKGDVTKQTKCLFESYSQYIRLAFDKETPTLIASTIICETYGAETILKEIGVQDPVATIGADIASIRSKSFNFPIIHSDEIVINEFDRTAVHCVQGDVVIETNSCMISVSANTFQVKQRSCEQVFSFFKQHNYISKACVEFCVVDYLIEPKLQTENGQRIYYTTCFEKSIDVGKIQTETDMLIRDSLRFLSGLKSREYIEKNTPSKRAWEIRESATSPSRIKSIQNKLHGDRHYIRL